MQKKDLVNHIQNLKGKVTEDATIKKFCNEISQLSTTNNLMTKIEELSGQLMVASNVNTLHTTHAPELEKQQAKTRQYSRRNNVEISGISNQVSDENLERKVINICKEAGKDLKPSDMKRWHRLPSGCINTSRNIHVIVKFMNRKHSKAMLCLKSQKVHAVMSL